VFHIDATSTKSHERSWAIASPVNQPATITYAEPRPIATVCAVINNFFFEYGNCTGNDRGPSGRSTLRVEALGRMIEFRRRPHYDELMTLLAVGALRSAALTECSFAAWEGATEGDLIDFADDVARLCCIVARQHTGIPVLSFIASDGSVVRRTIRNPVESQFRRNYALRQLHVYGGLPKLFRDCFDEHRALDRTDLWKTLPWSCASIEDAPYVEQRYATVMGGVEFLIRSSLIEAGVCTQPEAAKKSFPQLIAAARSLLRWDIPKHYTSRDRSRAMRNAVAHGGPLPEAPESVRHDLDKWSLFLTRRLLMRLKFDGLIASPHWGHASTSPVSDFSEDHNSFGRKS
jgi:hypothetical protein